MVLKSEEHAAAHRQVVLPIPITLSAVVNAPLAAAPVGAAEPKPFQEEPRLDPRYE